MEGISDWHYPLILNNAAVTAAKNVNIGESWPLIIADTLNCSNSQLIYLYNTKNSIFEEFYLYIS